MDDYDFLFKTLLVGDSGAGKTSLMHRFADQTFNDGWYSTIGCDFKIKTMESQGGAKVKLQLWDTAGQERFQSLSTAYYRGAHGVMLVHDINSKDSVKKLKHWISETEKHASPNVPKVVVGAKKDLMESNHSDDFHSDGLGDFSKKNLEFCGFHEELGLPYVETSARTGENVDYAFCLLNEIMLQKYVTETQGIKVVEDFETKKAPLWGENVDWKEESCCQTS